MLNNEKDNIKDQVGPMQIMLLGHFNTQFGREDCYKHIIWNSIEISAKQRIEAITHTKMTKKNEERCLSTTQLVSN